MSVEEAKNKKILAIGAHPDDIEFGCGGVLLKERRCGSRLQMIVCSRGESGTNGSPVEREQETRAASKMLGADLDFLDLGGDAQMQDCVENANTIARKIREIKPDIVLTPSVHENQHPDHAVVGRLTRDACRLARYGNLDALKPLPKHSVASLYFYYISSSDPQPTGSRILVDVSDAIKEWKTLMSAHESQMRTRNYLDFQISKAKALGLSAGVEYAIELSSNDPLMTDSLSKLPRAARSL